MVGNNAWVKFVTEKLERDYPNLTVYGYKLTSPDTIDYNCIAWAAEDDETWWWPDIQHQYYWPPDIPREETLEAFQEVYKMLGCRFPPGTHPGILLLRSRNRSRQTVLEILSRVVQEQHETKVERLSCSGRRHTNANPAIAVIA